MLRFVKVREMLWSSFIANGLPVARPDGISKKHVKQRESY